MIVFDHVDAYEGKDDRESIIFYWTGLLENLSAFCEGREIPFDHDAGECKEGMKPRVRTT